MFAYLLVRYNADMKPATSFRLSQTALDLLKQLADQLAISQTSVLELAIRQMAKEHDCKTPQQ